MSKRIYLDNSATTPVDPKVLEVMLPYYKEKFGNAGSVHSFGQEAVEGVDNARGQVAEFLGSKYKEVVFTSGATESNNMVLRGVIKAFGAMKPTEDRNKIFHIITTNIEHPAILEPCRELEKLGWAEVTYLEVDEKGLISLKELEAEIKDNTVLVSIMYVNNEVGVIQPIKEIGKLLKKVNKDRSEVGKSKIYFHTDAVQATNYCNCNVDYLNVDFMSLSAHKIYGPKGIGALYVREGSLISPSIVGGHQEYNLRSGTLNVPGIVGLGKACELLMTDEHKEDNQRLQKLRDKLWKELSKMDKVQLNGDIEKRVPSNLNVSFKGAEGESMLLKLDMEGIAVSTGSACSSGSLSPSHVLLALGLPAEICHASLRITLGRFTTEEDIDYVIKKLPGLVDGIRKITPKEFK